MTPRASTIVCTRDRPADLEKCLESLLANAGDDLEIIVVDQSSGEESMRIGHAAAARDPRVKYLRTNKVGKSKALNIALAAASGEFLLHTDDDCTVPRDWAARLVEAMDCRPDVDIIFGALGAPPIDWSVSYVPTFRPETHRLFSGRMAFIQVPKIGVGANMAVRRAVYDRVDGFDECLGPGCRFRSGDEWDMAYRALKAGFTAVHDPDNVVLHWGIREYASGAGGQLLRDKFYGVGAGYSKHVRCGDVVAFLALSRAALREASYLGMNIVRHRRLSGAGRLLYMAKGVYDGLRQPVDRKTWRYISVPDHAS